MSDPLEELIGELNYNRGMVVGFVTSSAREDADKEYEDLESAKYYLDRELQRLAKGWYNPPAYQVVEDKIWDWLPDAPPILPAVWQSLAQVPVGIVVADEEGDQWKVKPTGTLRIRFKGEKKWEKANSERYPLWAWDHFGPFTEVPE